MKWSTLAALMALEAVLLCAGISVASRNSSGTMSIPNTFTAGTTISSSSVNANFADIGTELTASLERNGKGGMLAALRGIDGTLAAPALSFTSETGSGLFRNGAGDVRFAVSGTLVQKYATTGITVPGNLTLSGVTTSRIGSGTAASSQAVFASSTDTPIGIYSHTTNPNINANATNDGSTGWKYATSNAALALAMEMGNNGYIFYTAPSGTAGNAVTFTERARVGTGGLAIGASGTAISASFRGTTSWNPGSIAGGGGNATTTITLTGAAAGADCVPTAPVPSVALPVTCWVTLNTCTLSIVNQAAGAISPGSGTYACRVFNP